MSDGGVVECSEHVDDTTEDATPTCAVSRFASLALVMTTCQRCTNEFISRPTSRLLFDNDAEDGSLFIQKSMGNGFF